MVATPAPIAAVTPISVPSGGAEGVKKALADTKSCLDRDDCDFPQTDPRSYGIAVGRRLAELLVIYREQHGDDPALGEIAREYMQVDDGFVQEEAIKAFSQLPPSSENVNAMITGLQHSSDPLLVEQAMTEWERYIGSPEEANIEAFLADFIARGGQFSSEKASELILKFLNERTEGSFRAALASMEPTSTPALNLRSALAEYDRQRSGG